MSPESPESPESTAAAHRPAVPDLLTAGQAVVLDVPSDSARPGYAGRTTQHLARLRRIEGQVRGLQRMVSEDTYCIDVLTQVAATTRALQSFAVALLEDHLGHCVAQACEQGGPEAEAKVAEATAAVARLLRA